LHEGERAVTAALRLVSSFVVVQPTGDGNLGGKSERFLLPTLSVIVDVA